MSGVGFGLGGLGNAGGDLFGHDQMRCTFTALEGDTDAHRIEDGKLLGSPGFRGQRTIGMDDPLLSLLAIVLSSSYVYYVPYPLRSIHCQASSHLGTMQRRRPHGPRHG
jgi:hypothetical protein